MKTGRRGDLCSEGSTKESVDIRFLVVDATRSIICAILSNSSGHMSGQCEKPK